VEIEISMLFADVRGSTALAERSSPGEFARLMQRFYGAATRVLLETDAIIDKYVGDEVVAFYVPALAGSEHAGAGVRGARALLSATGHADPNGPWVPVGIGLHTRVALVGSIGAEGVTDVTALGDAVNTAARLASLAGPGEALISEATCAAAGMDMVELEQRHLEVKGLSEPVAVRVLRVARAEVESG
jgi:adenylate cyclase